MGIHTKRRLAPKDGVALHLASFAFLGGAEQKRDGTFSMAFANFGLDSLPRPFASTSPPRGDRVTSGKLSSSSSRLPMYVNLGPRFCAAGAEVASDGQIESIIAPLFS